MKNNLRRRHRPANSPGPRSSTTSPWSLELRRAIRRVQNDDGLGTVEYVVIAIAVIGIALLLTAFLPGYLQGWIAQLPT